MRYRRDLKNFLARHRLRSGTIVGPSGAVASDIADASLDFVYLDGPTEYGPFCEMLRTWYPKVRPGGFIGGVGYLDGLLADKLYGVRTAVNELAREYELVIRLTLDDIQSWFTFKPDPSAIRPKLRIAVLTAYDEKQMDLASISSPNKKQYCDLHGYTFIEENTAAALSRSAVWAKVPLLNKYLKEYEWVFWTDVDSLVMDMSVPLGRFCDRAADMVICHEDLGVGVYNVNAGQLLFRSSDWSQWFLEETWRQTWAIKDPHQEQRAMIHLLWREDLSRHVHVVAQNTFNSYLPTYAPGDFLLHFPDMPNEKQSELMRYWAQFAG